MFISSGVWKVFSFMSAIVGRLSAFYNRCFSDFGLSNIIFFVIFFAAFGEVAYSLECGDNANPALKTVCDIIMFLQGRIGRALASFMIMLSAWSFIQGQFKWQEVLTVAIGVGIFFAPKTFALFLLPEYIQGIAGDGFDPSVKYTPDEIITCSCPNLR